MSSSRTVELLDYASMWFTTRVHQEDIEHERQQMEAKYRKKLAVHQRETVTRSGVECTRIEWKVVA